MPNQFYLLLVGFCLFCRAAAGQTGGYGSFDNIRLDTEASVVNCFLQDEQGMIWIGSDKGLFSYDGYATQAHFSFGGPYSSWIYCGVRRGDTLYLGADKGLFGYNTRTDRYETFPAGFPKDVRALAWQGNTLWMGTLGGLYRYRPDTGSLDSFDAERYPGLPHSPVYTLLSTHDGQLYVGTYNGLCRYRAADDRFEPVPLPPAGPGNNQFVNSLLEDRARGCIWIGMEGSLLRYTPSTGQAERVPTDRANSVKSLALDNEERLLIGTDNGLYIYKEGEITAHSIHDSRNPRSLANNIVWTVFCDREKNSWLGTNNGFSLARHTNLFRYVSIAQITGTGEGNQFYALYKDSRGYFWLGGGNGLIRTGHPAPDRPDAIWYKMNDPVHTLSHNRVRHLYEDPDRQLWVATDGSLNRYDYAAEQFIRYDIADSTGRYNANWAYHLFEDEAGQLWIATCLGGIFVVDKQKLIQSEGKRYVADRNFTTQDGLSGMFVTQLLPDRSGHVWALLYNSGNACIDKIDKASGRITHISTDSLTGNDRPGFLLCDKEGSIWAGYRGGVLQIDPLTDRIRRIPFGAFARHEVLFMAEVEGAIWVSTSNGFWVVDKQTLQVTRLSLTNRAFTCLYYDEAAHSLYMGEIDGLALFSTQGERARPSEDRPLLATALYINGRLAEGRQVSIRYERQLVLRPGENNFMLEFSDLPYSLEEKNKFVYRLEGLDREWNLLETDMNRITYTNLDYGRYQLWVAKLDANGQPSASQQGWDIVVEAPWYNTGLARAIYFLLAAGLLLWTVHFFRLRSRLRREHLEKEKILAQSRQKMDFYTNLSHDFKTPLSLIIGPLSKLLPEVKNREEKKLLEGAQRNAIRLNALVHQILDVDRMDNRSDMLLILSRTEFVSLARGVWSAYEAAAGQQQVELLFETDRETIYLDVDVIKWESILNNLLSNALKYTPRGGVVRLSVAVREESRELIVAVSDTGAGIREKDLPYIFQRFFQSSRTRGKKEGTGIGLYLVKTYAELHGAQVRLTSEENKGTTVTLSLPLPDPDRVEEAGPAADASFASAFALSRSAAEASVPLVSSSLASSSPGEESREGSPALPDNRPLVLVVDDNPEITTAVCDMLGAKYRCRAVSDGREGLKLCLELRPDLVITDLVMPEMDGIEMCRHIKKHVQTAVVPLILLTGKNDKQTELASIQLHIDAFIPKPFEASILLSRVEQLLSNRQVWEAKTRLEAIAEPKSIEAVSSDEKFLADITRLVEDHVADSDLNVTALCELSGVSNKQMYRKIKQLTGQTPVEYIKSIRMKKAAMLLEQRKFTVAEVMYMVGFSSSSYFSKCFQAEFGMTPKQFAESAG